MFIELPVTWDKEEDEDQVVVDLISINISEIYAFNPSSDGVNTSIRVYSREESWLVNIPYEKFKAEFEKYCGQVQSFILTQVTI